MRPADGRSDEALVAAFVAGDTTAFDRLVDRYERRVYGICYRYFGNAQDAEDAMQDTFVALLRRGQSFQGTAAFSTWLYRVATNACNDLARKRSRRPRTVPLDRSSSDGSAPEAADVPSVEDALANRELGLELMDALRELDPAHREAVVLHDVHGLPYADVAARAGVAVGTVKSRIHRAHARLAARLAHLHERAETSADEQAGTSADRSSVEPLPPSRPPTAQP